MSHLPQPDVLNLGVSGFTYADLYQPDRLRDLHDVFLRDLEQAEPDLRRIWDEYRQAPDAPRPATEVSLLYVRMAPYVSRFVARLFGVEAALAAVAAATRAQDDLFRFKVDFVRRRVLPLLKGGAAVALGDNDERRVRQLLAGQFPSDGEMAVARAGCLLLDREASAARSDDKAEQATVAEAIDALKRWCAVHMHDPEQRAWVVFRVPGNVDYFNLVKVEHRRAGLPTAIEGPADHLRMRDGFT